MTRLRAAIVVLIAVHLCIIFAGFVAPYSGEQQNRDYSFAPPSNIHFKNAKGELTRPCVYRRQLKEGSFDAFEEDLAHCDPIRLFVTGEPYKFLGSIPAKLHFLGVDEPGRMFLLGTDRYGRDLFSRFAHGGELSLLAGGLATALTLFLAAALGGTAGFFGRWADRPIMALSELFLALPWLYLLLAVRAFLPLNLEPRAALFLLIAVIGIVGWAKPARLVRGIVLEAKEKDFVVAARSLGATDIYLLRKHVLPQAYSVLLMQAALLVPQYILAEVTLSFVGLGIGAPAASWGTLLAELQQFYVLQGYWWMVLPACLMLPVFASYFLLASHLQSRIESAVS